MTNSEVDALVGQVVEERYRIEATLGAGGMGAVYLARHVKVGREVAIKVLHDHLVQDPTMVERFEREAAIAAKLDHKNLISVIDVGETPTKQKLMVLQLARGKSLAELIAEGPMAPARVVAMTAQILSGLEHAHRAGLVHRDLKPENIIVERDLHGAEVPKIVDFGIAMLRGDASARLTAAGQVLGTPQYMAPEHAQGKDVDPRSDLFALGVIVYEMLAGKLPFDAQGIDAAIANITKEPPPLAERTPGVVVDPLLETFARRLMARRRTDRFQCARAALDVLELLGGERDAAREILVRPSGPAAPLGLVVTRVPRGSVTPVAAFAGKTLDMDAPVPLPGLPPIVHAAVQKPEPCRPYVIRRRPPRKPWHPWKSFGLLAGAFVASLTAGILASTTANIAAPPPSLEFAAMPAPGAYVATRAVVAVEPPPAPVVVEAPRRAVPTPIARVSPRPVVRASVERVVVTPIVDVAVVPAEPTAADVATRYVALGQELARAWAKRDVSAAAARYSRVQIHQAMATPATRAAAMRELAAIETALDR